MDNLESLVAKLGNAQNIFLTGGAGVGKTTLTRKVIAHYESEAKKVAKLASTGMAATLLGGQTLHSFFDLGIADSIEDLERRKKYEPKKRTKKLIKNMHLIIIDEVSMVSASLMDMIRLRLLQSEFTGALLLVGDFLQLPPVVRGYAEVMFAFESESWSAFEMHTINLTKVYRTDDSDFIEVLNAVRFANVSEAEHYYLHHLIKPLPENLSAFTYLFGKNASALRHNQEQLSFLESDEETYRAEIIRHDKNLNDKEVERFISDARINIELQLKVGAPILFTRNSWNYFNGERAKIVKLEDSKVYVEKDDGVVVKLEQVSQDKTVWKEKTIEGKKEFVEESVLSVYQFPLQLAFAITIHKSQGMSIEDLIIETKEIFAPSQFYVALSRATSPARLSLVQPLKDWHHLAYADSKALNFVQEYTL